MNSIQDNIKKLSKESEARTSENSNLQKLVAEGFSRKTSVIPGIMSLPSKGSPKVVNVDAVKSVDYSKGMIDWAKSGNIDLMGKGAPYVAPPTPPEPEGFSFGNTLSFDGVNDYVSFPNEPLFEGRTTLTMSLWAKIPFVGGNFQVGSRTSGDDIFTIFRNASNSTGLLLINRASGSGAGSYQTYDASKFNLYDEWAHLVVVFEGSNPFQTILKLYINGVYTGYNYITPSPSTVMGDVDGNFAIGAFTTAPNYTKAEIDEVGIWHGVLTDEEIVGLYNNGFGDFATNYQPDILRRYYRFNGSTSDAVLIDEGLDGVDGTLEGFTRPPEYWVEGNVIIPTDGLQLYIDGSKKGSYPGFGTTITDISTNGHTGQLINGTSWSDTAEDRGAFYFDGINDYVSFGDILNMGTDSVTINAWYKPTSASGTGWIINKVDVSPGATGNRYGLLKLSGSFKLRAQFISNGGTLISPNTTTQMTVNQYQLVSIVFDRAGSIKFYINGVEQPLDPTKSADISAFQGESVDSYATYKLMAYTNSDGVSPAGNTPGGIGAVYHYNRVLTQEEIQSIYDLTKPIYGY